jgi:hypothetical protein
MDEVGKASCCNSLTFDVNEDSATRIGEFGLHSCWGLEGDDAVEAGRQGLLLAGVIPALGCSLFPAVTGGIAAGDAGVGALHAAMFNTHSKPLKRLKSGCSSPTGFHGLRID